MFNIFLILHLMLAVILVVVILLQRSDEGALGGIGGGSFSGMLTGRSSANFLTKITTFIAALFLCNCLLLAVLSGNFKKDSIITESEVEDIIDGTEIDPSKPIVPDTE